MRSSSSISAEIKKNILSLQKRDRFPVGAGRAVPGRAGPFRAAYTSKVGQNLTNFFLFSKLLVFVLGPVSVEELDTVEDMLSTRFARYGI